ncbi:hypothetical protein E4U53_006763, partial [Claviceps sorghi]
TPGYPADTRQPVPPADWTSSLQDIPSDVGPRRPQRQYCFCPGKFSFRTEDLSRSNRSFFFAATLVHDS